LTTAELYSFFNSLDPTVLAWPNGLIRSPVTESHTRGPKRNTRKFTILGGQVMLPTQKTGGGFGLVSLANTLSANSDADIKLLTGVINLSLVGKYKEVSGMVFGGIFSNI
jgi:hypothetical protein